MVVARGYACAAGGIVAAALMGGAIASGQTTIRLLSFTDDAEQAIGRDVSRDGKMVVGYCPLTSGYSMPVWWAVDGRVTELPLPQNALSGRVDGVSASGMAMCGEITDGFGARRAVRWATPTSEPVVLGEIGGYFSSLSYDMSGDGTTVVGTCFGLGQNPLPMIWKSNGFRAALPLPPGAASGNVKITNFTGTVHAGTASYVSSDGITFEKSLAFVVVGGAAGELPVPSSVWLSEAKAITGDGTIIVGGIHLENVPQGSFSAFPVRWVGNSMQELGLPPGMPTSGSAGAVADAVSGDGNVVLVNVLGNGLFKTWVWTTTGGYVAELRQHMINRGLPMNVWSQVLGFGISDDAGTVYGTGQVLGGPLYYVADLRSDSDGDGLYDDWETSGVPFYSAAGQLRRYLLPGANPARKDIYIEVDQMSGLAPMAGAIDMVVGSFDRAPVPAPAGVQDGLPGVALHVDTAGAETIPLRAYPSRWTEFQEDKGLYFGTFNERLDDDAVALLDAKKQAYRYCIFAHSFQGTGYSGVAELGGNDFMVTLGHNWTLSPELQAGTFMHELGHTLGLGHGGQQLYSEYQYKPNYFSVMNYLWQYPDSSYMPRGTGPGKWNRYFPDYSRRELPALIEFVLLESAGIQGEHAEVKVPYSIPVGTTRPGHSTACALLPSEQCIRLARFNGPVDWNNDGVISRETIVTSDINSTYAGVVPGISDFLLGHDDWSALKYNFRDSEYFADGAMAPMIDGELTPEIAAFLASIPADLECVGPAPTVTIPASAAWCDAGGTGINAQAQATGSLEYHWEWYDDRVTPPEWKEFVGGAMAHGTTIAGADLPTVVLSAITLEDLGYPVVRIRCRVVDTCGQSAVSGECRLHIGPPTAMTDPFFGPVTCPGGAATLTGIADADGNVTHRWSTADPDTGEPIPLSNGAMANGTIISGATTATLSIQNAQPADLVNGLVYEATDACGRTGQSLGVGVSFAGVRIVTNPEPVEVGCPSTSSVQFTVEASGPGPIAYRWRRNDVPLNNGGAFSGVTTATLTVATPGAAEAGMYSCRVSNSCGADTSADAPLISGPPTIGVGPLTTPACPDEVVFMRVSASGAPPLEYRWFKDGTELAESSHYIDTQTSDLRIDGANAGDVGAYTVRVRNSCGETMSAAAQLTLFGAPGFASGPSDATACVSGAATLTATPVAGANVFGIAWAMEDPAVPGQWIGIWDGPLDYGAGVCASISGSETYQMSVAFTGGAGCATSLRFRCIQYGCSVVEGSPARVRLCRADADCSGGLAVADIFTFLNRWFAGSADADFDASGGLAVADIFAYLNAWFAGCP